MKKSKVPKKSENLSDGQNDLELPEIQIEKFVKKNFGTLKGCSINLFTIIIVVGLADFSSEFFINKFGFPLGPAIEIGIIIIVFAIILKVIETKKQ